MTKEIKLTYYNSDPSETNTGMKHVLWEITDSEQVTRYDWGFADWLGKEWDIIEVPEGFTAKVAWWANPLDPIHLVSSIIRLN